MIRVTCPESPKDLGSPTIVFPHNARTEKKKQAGEAVQHHIAPFKGETEFGNGNEKSVHLSQTKKTLLFAHQLKNSLARGGSPGAGDFSTPKKVGGSKLLLREKLQRMGTKGCVIN